MKRQNTIIKNTIIYTIGNFGSKILSYVIVLIYTHYIISSELGRFDVLCVTVSLLQPIVLLMLDDSVYRWLLDDKIIDKRSIISTALKSISVTILITVVFVLIINAVHRIDNLFYFLSFFVSCMFYQMLLSSVRGLGNNKLYASSGIVNGLFDLLLETLGLIVFRQGVEFLFISKTLANIVTMLYIYMNQKEFHGVMYSRTYDKELAEKMMSYSLPLIPNNLCWWIVNSSDRYLVLFFLGSTANGIYSIANKFPMVVTTINSIVYLSIQDIFIKEYDSDDRDTFYSKLFNKYYKVLLSCIACGFPITKIIIIYLTGMAYKYSWRYTGFLFFSTAFAALGGILGIGYQISRETKRSIISTTAAALVNILINFLFIKIMGLHVAGFSTLVAYLFLVIIRYYHSKKYFNIIIEWRTVFGITVFAICVVLLSYCISDMIYCILIAMICIILSVALNIEIIRSIFLI